MNLFLTKISLIVIVAPAFMLLGNRQEPIRMMHVNTVDLPIARIQAVAVDFKDTIPDDTLFINRSEEGFPVSYFRKVKTGVCIDNECRVVNIILHWAITGRYLGFELPEGEFLSKSEHVEFNMGEYSELHRLLSKPYSLLADFSMDELTPQKHGETDGVTSATVQNVLGYVVEGAVYTTYTLWHIVYGNTRRAAINQTREELTDELLELILKSPNVDDQIWGLNHVSGYGEFAPALQNLVFGFIKNENFILAEKAIAAIPPEKLGIDSIQLKLLDQYGPANFGTKRLILKKLEEAPFLNSKITEKLAVGMVDDNNAIVTDKLNLFSKHEPHSPGLSRNIAKLLQHRNNFIAQKVYQFLIGTEIEEKKIKSQIEKYQSNQK